jgi:hypothetical protein
MLSAINKRIEKLEAEVFWAGPSILEPPTVKHGRGRRPLLETQELLQRRDHLTYWLEQNWPYLSVALRKARNSQESVIGRMR